MTSFASRERRDFVKQQRADEANRKAGWDSRGAIYRLTHPYKPTWTEDDENKYNTANDLVQKRNREKRAQIVQSKMKELNDEMKTFGNR